MRLAYGGIVLIVRVIGCWSSKATQSKAKQRKTKESKAWRKFFQISLEILQNSIEIKVQRGSGKVLVARFAPSCAVLGVWGGTWEHLAPQTRKNKNSTFLHVVGPSWEAFWRPCGLQEAILAASWTSWARWRKALDGFSHRQLKSLSVSQIEWL